MTFEEWMDQNLDGWREHTTPDDIARLIWNAGAAAAYEACATVLDTYRESIEYDTSISEVYLELEGMAAAFRARGKGEE